MEEKQQELNDLSFRDKKEIIAKFRNKQDFDIIKFWSSELFANYRFLNNFALEVLDHHIEDVDSERFFNFLEFINTSRSAKKLSVTVKRARLMALWNEELIFNFI